MTHPLSKYTLPLFLISVSLTLVALVLPGNTEASTNMYTGCLSASKHTLYNLKLGTSPSAVCNRGDAQVSADYGDLQSLTAGAGLTGGGTEGNVSLSLADSGVTTAKIADLAVTAAKIAANAITEAKLAAGAVTESIIADLVVTTGKIADLAITAAKIADGAITSAKIADNAVTVDKLSSDLRDAWFANNGGWTTSGETWTYTSASSFTVPGDQTTKYTKGTRLKFTQTTVKYGVVIGSSYSSPNTTVGILTNTDYTISNAPISTNYYSYEVNPQGYPGWFNLAAPTLYDGIDNGSGGNPTTIVYRINITGTIATVKYIGSGTKVNTTRGIAMGSVPVGVANTSNWNSYGSAYARYEENNYVGSVSGADNAGHFFIFFNTEIPDNAVISGYGFEAVYEI